MNERGAHVGGTKVGVIIQARRGSTRAKEKILRRLGKATVLDIVISRARALDCDVVVLATTDKEEDEVLSAFAKKHHIEFFQGSERDVLQRFIDAAEAFGIDIVVRVGGDDPFLDPEMSNRLIAIHKEKLPDYTSYELFGKPTILTHSHVYPEVIAIGALKKEAELFGSEKTKEHVTSGIYSHPETFVVELVPVPDFWQRTDIRLTVDTDEDVRITNRLIEEMERQGRECVPREIAEYLDTHTEMTEKMKRVIAAQEK